MRKFLILFFFSVSLFAQAKLGFEFDFSIFGYDESSNYLEAYYSISKSDLTNDGGKVKAILSVNILNVKDSSYLVNKKWFIEKPVDDTLSSDQVLIGVLGFRIPSGSYTIYANAMDANDSLVNKSYSVDFNSKPFISENVQISYLQLAKKIVQVGENNGSIFYKNSYEVTPNPSALYNSELPVVFYYSEIYNLAKQKGNFLVGRNLINSQGIKVYSSEKRLNTEKNSIVDVGMINMNKFPTDVYNLIISVRDSSTNNGALAAKKFFYYNPNYIDTTLNSLSQNEFISSEFGIYSEDELDLFFDQCKYIASVDEIDQYAKLTTVNGKREFLYNFWKKRDPEPSTKENEFKDEYLKRIDYVERHFGTMNRHGYKTDRGRVYLMYGEYDQIDRFPNPTNRKPYEIWYYNSLDGGVIFIFADLTGYSDYEFLHSTKRDEVKNYDWERRIIQY